ncbi:hypothetical protein J6590_027758 [Homalodisca vitripennis]|nr:hypothetical protein J6590_027758 [Homalodisca vitripennis]
MFTTQYSESDNKDHTICEHSCLRTPVTIAPTFEAETSRIVLNVNIHVQIPTVIAALVLEDVRPRRQGSY